MRTIVKFSGLQDTLQVHIETPLLPSYSRGACLRVEGRIRAGEAYPYILVQSHDQITPCP